LFLDEGRLSGIFEFLSKKRDGQAMCVAGQWIVIKQVEPGGGVGSRGRQREYRQTAWHTRCPDARQAGCCAINYSSFLRATIGPEKYFFASLRPLDLPGLAMSCELIRKHQVNPSNRRPWAPFLKHLERAWGASFVSLSVPQALPVKPCSDVP